MTETHVNLRVSRFSSTKKTKKKGGKKRHSSEKKPAPVEIVLNSSGEFKNPTNPYAEFNRSASLSTETKIAPHVQQGKNIM